MSKETSKKLLLILFSATLLILAFPDFEFWFLAWISLVPFFWAIYETEKQKAFILGWIWGILFFFGSCWWLTHAPIYFGDVPVPIAYLLIFLASAIVGLFPATFALCLSQMFNKFGIRAALAAPFLWTASEFARFWISGNNWNAIAYSQAFKTNILQLASIGGIYLVGFLIVIFNAFLFLQFKLVLERKVKQYDWILLALFLLIFFVVISKSGYENSKNEEAGKVVVVQVNVPGRDLNIEKWTALREKHIKMAESAINSAINSANLNSEDNTKSQERNLPILVVFPESPMNFAYGSDPELQEIFADFTRRNNVWLLFNSAEINKSKGNYFNSAIVINERGEKVGQYNKIFLVPFGEYAPVPEALQEMIPTIVGHFEKGYEYKIFSFGDLKFGIMICFESHFPNLSREFARMGADMLIEMTNDGYLGKTPVLRQHLANAVFRAVETGKPVIRATNVGITAYINEKGEILDQAESYTEASKIWSVSKSANSQTFYVKYGDWLAIICVIFTFISIGYGFSRT